MKTITIFTKEELEILRKYFYRPFEDDIIKIVNNSLSWLTIEDLVKITDLLNQETKKDLLFVKFNEHIKTLIVNKKREIEDKKESIKNLEDEIKQNEMILKYLKDSDNIWELISNIYLLK